MHALIIALASLLVVGAPAPSHVGSASRATIAARVALAPDDDTRARAQAAFVAGERAFAKGDYAVAVRQFALAQSLVPHPYTQYNLALAQRRSGDPVAAWHTFSDLSEHAPTAAQRKEAVRARAAMQSEVAHLTVRAPADARVCLNDEPLAIKTRHVVRPGRHVVRIDDQPIAIDVRGGEAHTVQRVGADVEPRAMPRKLTIGLFATAAVHAATATALGTAAAIVDSPRASDGLAIGAAVTAGAATIAVLAGLATLGGTKTPSRGRDHAAARTSAPPCAALTPRAEQRSDR